MPCMDNTREVTIVGAGLAGSEAALQLARRGVAVRLVEMRPEHQTPVHKTGDPAELVCSNSLKSSDPETAAGCLKHELAAMGSELYACALETRVAAGGALAVDRRAFSAHVRGRLESHPNIELVCARVDSIPAGPAIVATGPLTADALARALEGELAGRASPSTTRRRPSSRRTPSTSTWSFPSRATARAGRPTT